MQSRALFPGIVFILVGAAMLLSRLGLFHLGFWGVVWLVMVAGGLLLLLRGIGGEKGVRGRVFWGVVLLAFGTFRLLENAGFLLPEPGYVVAGTFAVVGGAFLAGAMVRPTSLPMTVIGAVCLLIGFVVLLAELDALSRWQVKEALATWWPLVLVLFGASMLIPRRHT